MLSRIVQLRITVTTPSILEGNICAAICTYERGARGFSIGWGQRSWVLLKRECGCTTSTSWSKFMATITWVPTLLALSPRHMIGSVYWLRRNVDAYPMDDYRKELFSPMKVHLCLKYREIWLFLKEVSLELQLSVLMTIFNQFRCHCSNGIFPKAKLCQFRDILR